MHDGNGNAMCSYPVIPLAAKYCSFLYFENKLKIQESSDSHLHQIAFSTHEQISNTHTKKKTVRVQYDFSTLVDLSTNNYIC
jgi:hypothetical protein